MTKLENKKWVKLLTTLVVMLETKLYIYQRYVYTLGNLKWNKNEPS